MISKRELLEALDINTEQIAWQGKIIAELGKRVAKLEKETCSKKSANAKGQFRDEHGKFAKKK